MAVKRGLKKPTIPQRSSRRTVLASGASSNSTTTGLIMLLQRGIDHTLCTSAAGKTNTAAVSAKAANQGQKKTTPARMQAARVKTAFVRKNERFLLKRKTPGNKSA